MEKKKPEITMAMMIDSLSLHPSHSLDVIIELNLLQTSNKMFFAKFGFTM
ncbi:MAG: hypothetical protein IPQ04_07800 [Saprospiraceae bacterium]|nr:hypothetical protein [Saprospiraceae bacterium]